MIILHGTILSKGHIVILTINDKQKLFDLAASGGADVDGTVRVVLNDSKIQFQVSRDGQPAKIFNTEWVAAYDIDRLKKFILLNSKY